MSSSLRVVVDGSRHSRAPGTGFCQQQQQGEPSGPAGRPGGRRRLAGQTL
ncbi:peptidase A8 [Anopheles sinensis]|uniref:Peptidase A8 n=1 Tax=Anopheles sinensis TaxID=74873 RepID=A0A084VSW0_ANOSI|nr:peptidase A8 [Anopheles sinensis]